MRSMFILIGCCLFFTFCTTHRTFAITPGGPQAAPVDETVTGTYKGYKYGMVILMRADDTTNIFPFEPTQKMLQKIAKTAINSTVTITIAKGIITRFEVK